MRLIALLWAGCLCAQDAREIVKKSIELDQANWLRMKDYTWTVHEKERSLDSNGQVKSENSRVWETLILAGEPHRRILERDGKPLAPAEARKQQENLDKAVEKLQRETPEQKQRRMANYEKNREKEREFLREVPHIYDFRLEQDDRLDGHDVWVIAATPKAGYQAKRRETKAMQKIRGELWIDKAEYQWVRLEAQTIDTISFGLFIARLSPGAKLIFEQTRVNDEIWLPKREWVRGSGRLGLLKKLSLEQELLWTNYRKFQVNSTIKTGDSALNHRFPPAGAGARAGVAFFASTVNFFAAL